VRDTTPIDIFASIGRSSSTALTIIWNWILFYVCCYACTDKKAWYIATMSVEGKCHTLCFYYTPGVCNTLDLFLINYHLKYKVAKKSEY